MKLNLTDLSKMKHVYKVYEDDYHCLHCVKYPVIYINANMTYYKVPGSEQLDYATTRYIHELCNDEWIDKCTNDKIRGLFWEVDPTVALNSKIRSDKYKLLNAEMEVRRAKAKYEEASNNLLKANFVVNKLNENAGDFTFKMGDILKIKSNNSYFIITGHDIPDTFLYGRTCYPAKEYTSENQNGVVIDGFVITYTGIYNSHYIGDKLLKFGTDIEDAYPDDAWEKVYHLSDELLLKYLTDYDYKDPNDKEEPISMEVR